MFILFYETWDLVNYRIEIITKESQIRPNKNLTKFGEESIDWNSAILIYGSEKRQTNIPLTALESNSLIASLLQPKMPLFLTNKWTN